MNFVKKIAAVLMAAAIIATSVPAATNAASSPKATSISKATVTVKNATYNGKAQDGSVSVTLAGKKLVKGKDYTVKVSPDSKNAGKKTVTIVGIGKYAGTVKKSFTINKATAKISISTEKRTSAKKNVKKAIKIKVTRPANSKLTFKVSKATNKKGVYVSAKNGIVSITKRAKKGTYKVTVTITNKNYKTVTKTVTIKVK